MPETSIPGLQQFVEEVIPSKLPMNWHHKLFYDILENKVIQKEDGRLYENHENKVNQNLLILAPRFHAKSQCFTINYPLWEIYKNPDVRIIIISANEEIAISFNRAIMNNLENNTTLTEKYGYLVPQFQDKKKWGEKSLIIKRPSLEKDPTVIAIGVGGKMISKRADIIIVDDLIDLESARTPQARKKIREWFENVLLPILEDDGRLIIAGTVWYKDDIYDSLWNESNFSIKLKLKALIYDERYERKDGKEIRYIPYSLLEWTEALKAQDVFAPDTLHRYRLYMQLKSGVLWHAKWSFAKLMRKMSESNMSRGSFLRQYLNEPTSEEEVLFKESLLRRALENGNQKYLVPSWDNINPDRNLAYGSLITAIGVDLAISKNIRSDKSAIAVWGLDEKMRRIPLWLDQGRWSPDETKQKIIELYHAFRPVKVRVENVAFQDMLRQELAQDIPVEGFHTTSTKKFNEETGLSQIAMLLEQEKIILPSSAKFRDRFNMVKTLKQQLSSYAYGLHAGDLLMASWFAIDVLRDFDRKMKENRGFFSTSALVEQLRNVRASHRIVILGYKPPVFRFTYNSLVYIFRPVTAPTLEQSVPFITSDEPFMIFSTRYDRSVAYIFQKQTNEIVGKIEGDLNAISFASLLEKAGLFFNNAQIVMDRNGEGEAILLELQQRDYRNVLVYQPDKDGSPVYEEGYKISAQNLPLAVDYFKGMVDGMHVDLPDEQLVKEMSELISVDGEKLSMSFGEGQRIKTVASALWLLDNYENMEKTKMIEKPKKKRRIGMPRYRVFQK